MTIASTLRQNETQYATDDCLEEIINNTRAVRQDSEKNRFKLQVNNFLAEVASGFLVISSDLIGSIEKRIADIDKLMSEQLSLIMHATEFQKIESAWTGLYKLVQSSVTENVKYTVLHCTKKSYSRILNQPRISTSLYYLKIFMKASMERSGGHRILLLWVTSISIILHRILIYWSIFPMLLPVRMPRF